ncbi:sensor histidine kinase [Bartonella clarridgeiae 73]|uniref:histidine kinase n=1 Tax=Bartonella clarridgeiae (strain CCUG 45776 / CIP 104772 / 73) TaxID=696125 RepID=E6YGM2_BARC7|nr:ATP-binding protein [Bartonella clarridgeiae]WCR55392.1 MAG: Osmolarity sensor protein [Bartonella clarridgeiae]CBI76010.1 sensor histidine kinase [Bartonella clarridgeiae 73]
MIQPAKKIARWLSKKMPKRLYARSLIIIIAPMVLLQTVIGYVFMERHWQMVTERLSTTVVHDIAAIIDIIETYPQQHNYEDIKRIAQQRMGLNISILPPDSLPPPGPKPFFAILDYFLSEEITRQINRPFWIDTVGDSNLVEIRIRLDHNILRVFAMRSQAYASNTSIFLSWMVGTALVLLLIAIYFLRHQIKPIQQLAKAAESFGRGHPLPEGFQPQGADEIRRAGIAFLRMRERIERQIEQRTMMLSGVSHDLRTILTRFKLQLALVSNDFDINPLEQDVSDMQNMLEGYLAFARGEGSENISTIDLNVLMQKFSTNAHLHQRNFSYTIEGSAQIQVRPHAFTRLIGNLLSNAFYYANTIQLTATSQKESFIITIDDDGPGIQKDMHTEVFKPFFRLDKSRNQDASGTGLGLSIAQDIARSHGGNIQLDDSPLGGLRAIVDIPL